MPELNLEILKNKKKTTDKYRPYDIPSPSTDNKNQKKPAGPKGKTNETNSKSQVNDSRVKPASTPNPNFETKTELELKKRVKELEKQLQKDSNKNDSIPSLKPTEAKHKTFNFKNNEIDNEVFYKILEITSLWNEPERKLFLYILEMTNYGKIKDVKLGRRDIESNVIHGRYFTNTRDNLVKEGVLSYRSGYIETTRKQAVFYSVNLRDFFNSPTS